MLSRVSLLWSDHLSRPLLFSSLLHCWPLTSQTLRPLWTADAPRTVLTVPLLSAAIDSRPLPSFLKFLFFTTSLLQSSSLPSSPTQEVRIQIRLQEPSLDIVSLLMFCVHLCLSSYFISNLSVCCLLPFLHDSRHSSVKCVCIHACFVFIRAHMILQLCIYVLFILLLSRRLICVSVFCLHTFKAAPHDGAQSQAGLIKVKINVRS